MKKTTKNQWEPENQQPSTTIFYLFTLRHIRTTLPCVSWSNFFSFFLVIKWIYSFRSCVLQNDSQSADMATFFNLRTSFHSHYIFNTTKIWLSFKSHTVSLDEFWKDAIWMTIKGQNSCDVNNYAKRNCNS